MEKNWSKEKLATVIVMKRERLDYMNENWRDSKEKKKYIKIFSDHLSDLEEILKKKTKKKEREKLIKEAENFVR